jgi:hypothetical protein
MRVWEKSTQMINNFGMILQSQKISRKDVLRLYYQVSLALRLSLEACLRVLGGWVW